MKTVPAQGAHKAEAAVSGPWRRSAVRPAPPGPRRSLHRTCCEAPGSWPGARPGPARRSRCAAPLRGRKKTRKEREKRRKKKEEEMGKKGLSEEGRRAGDGRRCPPRAAALTSSPSRRCRRGAATCCGLASRPALLPAARRGSARLLSARFLWARLGPARLPAPPLRPGPRRLREERA